MDISPFVEHPWYGWVKFWDSQAGFPNPKEVHGHQLGPALDIGPAMMAKILKDNGQVLNLSTYRGLTEAELINPTEIKAMEAFDAAIEEKIGKPMMMEELRELDPDAITPEFELYGDDIEGTRTHVADIDNVTPEQQDNYIGAKVNLPFRGTAQQGKVTKRAQDNDGQLTGTKNDNPILDTHTYEVEFPDGATAEFSANVIAEHMFAQCDPVGNQFRLMDEIMDYKKDATAINFADRFITVNGRQYHRKSTVGWKICIMWKDGSTSWEKLSDLKESYPIEVTEFATAQGIGHEPAFGWWVPYVLK